MPNTHDLTFALHRPSVTVPPAQLRTSWAKRVASESSYDHQYATNVLNRVSYNDTPIDSNYKVKPWLEGELEIRVSQDLETERGVVGIVVGRLGVQPRYEAIECVKHDSLPVQIPLGTRWSSPG
jgi:hypothetical protein